MKITAVEAGEALGVIAVRLYEKSVLQAEGLSVLQRLSQEMKGRKDAASWSMAVDRGTPILFAKTKDKGGRRNVIPSIVAEGVDVDQDLETVPFRKLDIALEFHDDLGMPIARWHLDLANRIGDDFQSGPLTHLQYGGHLHGAPRQLDHPLKVPRWCHPPMEFALLCEVVAANFFEEAWLDLRDEPGWCRSVTLFQRLCYTGYVATMTSCLSASAKTALHRMWASFYD